MAVGFPPGVAPKEERAVATGTARTMLPVPVVTAPRLCAGVGSFTLAACGAGPGAGLAGRPGALLLMSCRLKLRPWRRLLADAVPKGGHGASARAGAPAHEQLRPPSSGTS